MSSRCYPIFVKGNPQLRVFMPNFWMKLVKPKHAVPPNQVVFHVSMEMTKFDVSNYLEKIYKVPVKDVRIDVKMGTIRKALGNHYLVKDDDIKVAYVVLPNDCKFEFPNLFPEAKKEEERKELEKAAESEKQFAERKTKNWHRPGIPFWFGE